MKKYFITVKNKEYQKPALRTRYHTRDDRIKEELPGRRADMLMLTFQACHRLEINKNSSARCSQKMSLILADKLESMLTGPSRAGQALEALNKHIIFNQITQVKRVLVSNFSANVGRKKDMGGN